MLLTSLCNYCSMADHFIPVLSDSLSKAGARSARGEFMASSQSPSQSSGRCT